MVIFRNLKQAREKQNAIKKLYGYKPSVFMVKGNKALSKPTYVVIIPKGLKRIVR